MSPAALPRTPRGRVALGALACLAVAGLLLWWLVPAEDGRPHGRVTFSSGVTSGVYEKYGKLLQRAAARDLPELDIDLITSDGSQENVSRVAQGRADFTVAAADAVEQYQLEGYPGGERLRGCARLYDDYIQLVVPAESDIEKAADLRDKRVAVGQDRSGVRLVADRVLKAAGLDLDHDVRAVASGIDDAPDRLERGEIDAFFWSGGLPTSSVRELSERDDIRLVPLGSLVTELHRQGGAARYYRAAAMPADAYPHAQNSAVPTLAVANLLVTTVGQDAAITEGLTRTVIDNRDHIGSTVHAAQLVDLRTAIYTDPLPLHAGARDYYRSVKP